MLRRLGVVRFKSADFEVDFGPEPVKQAKGGGKLTSVPRDTESKAPRSAIDLALNPPEFDPNEQETAA